ncbi:fungal-specific transcription factor domain-containing protein [Aspergillus karnatakaensis]|uniref:Zn(II)2Cys6 transcription factor n=1 Tax=Aspergillus karnatakaensis TaxID=1810916 RepID=UPI003CCCF96A
MARSCGTCRDRRISCDRALPSCTQCTRANRACKGYGIRLSWPKATDRRRAVVARPARGRGVARQVHNGYQVNASSWDIVMHRYLAGQLQNGEIPLVFEAPLPVGQMILEGDDSELIQYFQQDASQSLATLGHDPRALGDTLMRMAFSSNSPSAIAVRRALLGLSCLHRYGLQGQAVDYKIASIRALAFASTTKIGTVEAMQHVAAGMLLCSLEIHKASCTSGQWRWYIAGVKKVIASSCLGQKKEDSDLGALLSWVQYHDTLARFSCLHWKYDLSPTKFPTKIATQVWCKEYAPVRENVDDPTPVLKCSPSIVNSLLMLLAEGCEILNAKQNDPPGADQTVYDHFLQKTISQLRLLSVTNQPGETPPPTIELFHLAALVYLTRASGSPYLALELQQYITRAFTLMASMPSCDRQFSLLVLGCEATTEDERFMVLDLIDRTEKRAGSRSLFLTSKIINRIWVQDDLAEGGLEYMTKLSAIIGSCGILPPFV